MNVKGELHHFYWHVKATWDDVSDTKLCRQVALWVMCIRKSSIIQIIKLSFPLLIRWGWHALIDLCPQTWPLIGQGWKRNTPKDKTPVNMSVEEASQRATSPVPVKPEAKPRPEIPPKPSPECSAPSEPGSIKSFSEGKVKRIVNKFSKQESVHKDSGDQPTNGTEVTPSKRFKRPPTVKPKPRRSSLQLQIGAEQAPPLPVKRSRKPKDNEQGEEADSVSVEGGRSGTAELTQVLLNGESYCIFQLALAGCWVWYIYREQRSRETMFCVVKAHISIKSKAKRWCNIIIVIISGCCYTPTTQRSTSRNIPQTAQHWDDYRQRAESLQRNEPKPFCWIIKITLLWRHILSCSRKVCHMNMKEFQDFQLSQQHKDQTALQNVTTTCSVTAVLQTLSCFFTLFVICLLCV